MPCCWERCMRTRSHSQTRLLFTQPSAQTPVAERKRQNRQKKARLMPGVFSGYCAGPLRACLQVAPPGGDKADTKQQQGAGDRGGAAVTVAAGARCAGDRRDLELVFITI